MNVLHSPPLSDRLVVSDGLRATGPYCDTRAYKPDLRWNYAAKGVLCRGETSVLYGPSNCGKSAVVCHLGHCIVNGTPFFGAKVKKGAVIHVCAEAPKSVQERVHAYGTDATAAPYLVRTAGVDLSIRDDVDDFLEEMEAIAEACDHDVVLIVFDTLARSIGELDENCSNSMTRVAETAERLATQLNAHVMLVHHTGKDTERGGRGSSALRGAVYTELCLKPDGKRVVLSQEKQRAMPKAAPVQFKTKPVVLGKDEDEEDRTTVHVVELETEDEAGGDRKPNQPSAGSPCDTAVLTALHIRHMTPGPSAETFRPRDILDLLPDELFADIAADSRVRRVSRTLEKLAGRPQPVVEKVDGGWRLAPARSCDAISETSDQK